MTGPNLEARASARRELTLRRARRDLATFTEYAFGLDLAPHHVRWCNALSESRRLVLLAPVEHGKTTVASIALPLWVLGNNPDARIAIVSETATQAVRILGAIREHALRNPRLREVFPRLKPATGARAKWSDSEIVVARSTPAKDPSVLAMGVMGPILGARLDLAILDDTVSWENSLTAGQRAKLLGWFRSTLVGRVVADGRIVVVGTPWHNEDLLAVLAASGEYEVIRDPAISDAGEPLWPEAWPAERLAQRRREIGEVEFSRQMILQVIADSTARFRAEWIEQAFREAEAISALTVEQYAGPLRTFTGVDLAVGLTAQHDESALFTIALMPDGRRQVLNVEAGRWQAPELVARIRQTHERYRSTVRVETNAAQAYIAQFLSDARVPVESHTTGRNRHDPVLGIESLAVELEQGRWIVPEHPETRAWARELLTYSPSAHPGDRLVASWLAREAARQYEARSPLNPVTGLSEFEEYDDDDYSWVCGPSRPVLPKDKVATTIPGFRPRQEPLRRPPYICR